MSYAENKARARTRHVKPTATDQSQARETDINVIVGKMNVTGLVPGASTEPMYGDFSNLPTSLREFIEQARSINRHRRELPKEIRDLNVAELLELTPEQLTEKLTPPATTPATTEEPT